MSYGIKDYSVMYCNHITRPMCIVTNGIYQLAVHRRNKALSAATKTASYLLTLPNYHCFLEKSGAEFSFPYLN